MADFLFTWKSDNWPYENLKELIRRCEAGDKPEELWRCQAHTKIKPGDRAYLFKQGSAPNGVFGFGFVSGPAVQRQDPQPGESRYAAPIAFQVLGDPIKNEFIALKDDLPQARWDTPASGVVFAEDAARAVDKRIAASGLPIDPTQPSTTVSKRERIVELYERDRSIVRELRKLYGGHCQLCGEMPFGGRLGSITEGHHINWLCRGGSDSRANFILLCPNHHAAIHASDPSFDWETMTFEFEDTKIPIKLNKHLRRR